MLEASAMFWRPASGRIWRQMLARGPAYGFRAAAEPCRTISTRRFCAFPEAEALEAMGLVSP